MLIWKKRFRRNAEFVVADLLVNVRLAVYEDERALFGVARVCWETW